MTSLLVLTLACISIVFSHTITTSPPQNYQLETILNNGSEDGVQIIDGNPAIVGQFPWQVGIIFTIKNGSTYSCGGALISNDWVLTAAHCVVNAIHFTMHFGGVTLYNNEPGKILREASNYYYHPGYNAITLNYDVGLIKLNNPITFSQTIHPARFPARHEDVPVGRNVIVSGFGSTYDNDTTPSILRWTNLQVISNQKCLTFFKDIINSTLCTVGYPRNATCHGDSGGPLVSYDGYGNAYHVGIVSFGAEVSCERGYPSAFVRTSYVLDWIADKTGINV